MLIHGIPITFAPSLSWEEVSKIAEELSIPVSKSSPDR
ncbi:hypothetical protein SRRS_54500 [Sporomusa rhizae]